jgi:hypothetical protein|tara:strand:- start:803 stop:1456 length:654 start_codon:yes stop_codon:yes gene_type:complete
MAVIINGNGTITGLAVGGLPDGCVDTDTLATNAVTSAKLASGAGGKILQAVTTSVATHTAYSFTSAATFLTLYPINTTVTPVATNSKFIITAQVSGEGTQSNQVYFLKLIRNVTAGFADGNNVDIAIGDNTGFPNALKATSAFHGYNADNADSTISTAHINSYIDSPNVSAGGNLQYKVQLFSQVTSTWYLNRTKTEYNQTYGDFLPSYLTVMELAT